VRRLRRLLQKRSTRWAERAFVVEGVEVVRSALDAGARIESVYLGAGAGAERDVGALAGRAVEAGARSYRLAPGVLELVSDTVTPQPLLAVLPMIDRPLADLPPATLVVVCADVRDPGNAGTILRSADAAGAGCVVFAEGSVDPFNPKTVRASAGSVFHVPVVVSPVESALAELRARGQRCLGAVAHGGQDYVTVDWRRPSAIVLGNEAHGLAGTLRAALDGFVGIPLAGAAESLNVGVACAVLCFEALRQRRDPGSTMPPMPEAGR
jgi:TrmH family RNA methyltransferase